MAKKDEAQRTVKLVHENGVEVEVAEDSADTLIDGGSFSAPASKSTK